MCSVQSKVHTRLQQGCLPPCADPQGLEALDLTWTFTVPRFEYSLLTEGNRSQRDGTPCLLLSHAGHRYRGDMLFSYLYLHLLPIILSPSSILLTTLPLSFSSPFALFLLRLLSSIRFFLSSSPAPLTSLPPFSPLLPFFFSFPSFFPSPFFLLRSSYPCLFPIPLYIFHFPFPCPDPYLQVSIRAFAEGCCCPEFKWPLL